MADSGPKQTPDSIELSLVNILNPSNMNTSNQLSVWIDPAIRAEIQHVRDRMSVGPFTPSQSAVVRQALALGLRVMLVQVGDTTPHEAA